MNRLRYVKDRETGKRVSRPNPPDRLIHHGVRELLLIDQELWDAAKTHQTELTEAIAGAAAGMPAHAPWDRRRPRYLLSALMRCAPCAAVTARSAPTSSAAQPRATREPAPTGSTSAATI